MTTKRRRKRIGRGVYRDRYGLAAIVKVGAGDMARQRERRFPFDTPAKDIKDWQERTRVELRRATFRPAVAYGTLAADVAAYLPQVAGLASYKSIRSELAAWTALYGSLNRSRLTPVHVRKARAQWQAAGVAPKTCNNRLQALRGLYRVLDGEHEPTPVDEIKPLKVTPSVPVLVAAKVFRVVAANLTDPKVKARFQVLACTGARPAEVKRAQPADVDLAARTWTVRTAKGGSPRTLYLNDDMLVAWRAFVAADAWGPFDTSDYGRALYAAGWPKNIRPYQARHSVALALSAAGGDLGDVQGVLGHRQVETTRRFYAPILAARLKRASEQLDGRFGGWAPLEPEADETVH